MNQKIALTEEEVSTMQTLFNLDIYERYAEEMKAAYLEPQNGDWTVVRDRKDGECKFYLYAGKKWYRQGVVYLEPEMLRALIDAFAFEYGYHSADNCECFSSEPQRQEI